MRPYRGMTKDGKWVYGWYIKTDFASYIVPVKYAVNWKVFIEVISETVGQQTGLKDKNGKAIYEGDIYKYTYCYYCNFDTGERKCKDVINVVKRDDEVTGFHPFIDQLDYFYDGGGDPKEIEVIDTIHENPELLKD